MIRERRDRFNREFSPDRYDAFIREVQRRAGVPVLFRLSETPCFFPADLMDRLAAEAQAMVRQLLEDGEYRRAADAAVPARFRVASSETRPTFVQVDFGLVRIDGRVEGRLVELQAFPSLYAFQPALAATYLDIWHLDGLSPYLGHLDAGEYARLCRRAIVGSHDPAEAILMELDPERQKTLPDFRLTERMCGIRTVNVRDVRRDGRRLVYRDDGGRTVAIARVYNRVVPDDLERSGAELAFDFRDDLDVEWAGGPDWFFRISKFSLPWLRHPWVPESRFLDEVDALPADRGEWLLKPLFSFAGGGIVFAPDAAAIEAIPAARRGDYLLQRRIAFTPVIETPHGPTQAEIRIMLTLDAGAYRPAIALVRMGRGRMMGVDHNKDLEWVGASAALIDPAPAQT